MLEGHPFKVRVKNMVTASNEAGHCVVRILRWSTKAGLVEFDVSFASGPDVTHEEIFSLKNGTYAVEVIYHDKLTNLAYEKYFQLFTIF